jgi:hypothetical protein
MGEYKKLSELGPKAGDVFVTFGGLEVVMLSSGLGDCISLPNRFIPVWWLDKKGYKFKRYIPCADQQPTQPRGENTRAEILRTASELINGDRQGDYGTPQENFARIAAGWSVILGKNVTPEQVARCMAWLKIARLNNGPHKDSYIDAAGYMALAAELGLIEGK